MPRVRTTHRFAAQARAAFASAVALAAALAAAPTALAQTEPYYWRQRVFFIPYQANAQDPQAGKIDKVHLLVSRDGGQTWAELQAAEPHVRGFSYHAATDGEYAFALQMSDRREHKWPERIAAPLLRIVVDTQPPALQLVATLDPTGQVVLKYEARDLRLKPQTLRFEAQTDAGPWQRIAAGPPDLSQPDRLVGQLAWRPPTAGGSVNFRAAIEDAAGNPGAATATTSLVGPVLDPAFGPELAPPNLEGPAMVGPTFDSQAAAPAEPSRTPLEWPSSNMFAADRRAAAGAGDPVTANNPFAAPPASNVYGGGGWPPVAAPTNAAPGSANSLDGVPALLPVQSVSQGQTATPTPAAAGGWTSTATTGSQSGTPPTATAITPSATDATFAANAPLRNDAPAGAATWVNSLTFDLDYDIQTVGPWGVAKVELWGTKDGGRQWQALGVDQDNRSPMRVTVPGAGVYGFRILVDGGNGAAAATPQPGDAPELIVGVDLAAPHAELRAAEPGQGAFAGQLLIRWTAQDENLAPRPIGLFSSATTEGPWTTIATDLENSGEYAWRLGRDAPPRVFLRLEARDIAGNVEVIQSPTPVDLNVPRPTGRLRNVRPVEADPDRYRTASGARPAEG